MCRNYIYIILAIITVSAYGQRKYEAFDIINDSLVVPPNGIFLSGNTFMDDSEVMNSHYLEYLHFLAQDSSDEAIIKAYPDTNIFGSLHLKKFLQNNRKYYQKKKHKHKPVSILLHDDKILSPSGKHHWYNYFSYAGTKHCPVVGISYEQAVSYCKWRSDFVSTYFNSVTKNKPKYKQLKDKNVRFEFFLPSEEEWEAAAAGGVSFHLFPHGYRDVKDSSETFNIMLVDGNLKTKNKTEPQFIFSHMPNLSGFYNIIGNVSEMITVKGVSKGGSYAHKASECKITDKQLYKKPERWLGFRCLCKVTVTPFLK